MNEVRQSEDLRRQNQNIDEVHNQNASNVQNLFQERHASRLDVNRLNSISIHENTIEEQKADNHPIENSNDQDLPQIVLSLQNATMTQELSDLTQPAQNLSERQEQLDHNQPSQNVLESQEHPDLNQPAAYPNNSEESSGFSTFAPNFLESQERPNMDQLYEDILLPLNYSMRDVNPRSLDLPAHSLLQDSGHNQTPQIRHIEASSNSIYNIISLTNQHKSECCIICYQNFTSIENLQLDKTIVQLKCKGKHIFHKKCIDEWLKYNSNKKT